MSKRGDWLCRSDRPEIAAPSVADAWRTAVTLLERDDSEKSTRRGWLMVVKTEEDGVAVVRVLLADKGRSELTVVVT